MQSFKDTWGLYNWTVDFNKENDIYPDDLEKFRKLFPTQKIFHCIDCTDQYIILKYENIDYIDEYYRVKPVNYEQKSKPDFQVKETVKIKKSGINGIIREICWHFKNNNYFYLLIIDDKKLSKRYYGVERDSI